MCVGTAISILEKPNYLRASKGGTSTFTLLVVFTSTSNDTASSKVNRRTQFNLSSKRKNNLIGPWDVSKGMHASFLL